MARVSPASTAPGKGWFAEARAEEQVLRDVQERRAARTVAGHSVDAAECAQLLEMLGLRPSRGN